MDMNEYLNTPIPRKVALAVVIGQGVANFVVTARAMRKAAKQTNVIIADLNERIKIYDESIDFLLTKADEATIVELNRNLDFWRVVRRMEPRTHTRPDTES